MLLCWPRRQRIALYMSGVRPSVRLSVCPVGIFTVTRRGSMQRGQRNLRFGADNKETRHLFKKDLSSQTII